MRIIFTILIAAVLVVIGAAGFAVSGLYDVSASSPHGGVVNWLLSTTSHASIERHSRDVDVPDLSDVSLARAGANDFDAMCAGCHGAPGQEPDATGQGLNPPAPDLAESAAHMNSAELFWVTKHGIKMTGMPAWGASHEDDALWPVVAFITMLPDLDADSYQAFLASADGMGHHDGGDDNGSHEHGDGDTESTATSDSHEHGEAAPKAPSHHETPDNGDNDHGAHSHDEPTAEKAEEPHDDGHDHEH